MKEKEKIYDDNPSGAANRSIIDFANPSKKLLSIELENKKGNERKRKGLEELT